MKNKWIVALLLSTSLLLSGCTHIEDTNGENNYDLVTFTDEDLLSSSSTFYSITTSSRKYINNRIEGKKSASKFSGVDTLEIIISQFQIHIESQVSEGNFLIYVVKDNEIVQKIEPNKVHKNYFSKGNYKLKMAGESAKFSLEYIIEFN